MPRTSTVHAVTTIGIDMGKNTLHMIGLDTRGAIVLREKVSRGRIASRLANLPSCLIGIEAGLATHYVARELAALGHDVKQVPPTYAKPFRQGHKNDFRDAHSVAEAVQRPTTRFVPVKTDEQLDLQALHRVRSRLVSERTAVVNQIRGFLLERGIIVRQGLRFLRQALPDILAKRTDILSPRMVRIVADLASDWRWLDERIEPVTDEIETLAKSDDGCRRVMTVPGIGPIISSAMVAAIGNGAAFARGRVFRHGSGSSLSRCRPETEPSSGASPSAATDICARSSCKLHGSFCCGRRAGRSMASGSGSLALPSACTVTFWPRLSPTSWHGSPGRCWHKSAVMKRASPRQQPNEKRSSSPRGWLTAQANPKRWFSSRGLRVGKRRWRKVSPARS
jgi:transposase